ncbi:MAG: hypothetical protein ACKO37_03325 [Vampirovibrionales bacterium]
MSLVITDIGTARAVVPAGGSVAVYTQGRASVGRILTELASPLAELTPIGVVTNGQTVFGPFTNGTTIVIENKTLNPVYYEVGTAPVVQQGRLLTTVQVDPATLNATGTLTGQLCLTGLVTSTTAAAVTGTLDTGAALDVKSTWGINDAFIFTVINTGATNAFTVAAAASGHTLVGSGTVAASSSGRFMTRKTAANTFVTYRL